MVEEIVPVFRVTDAGRSFAWYERLGFEREFEHRFEPHLPMYLGIRRGDVRIHLSEHAEDAPTGSCAYLWVDDVDPIGQAFGVTPDDEPWAREVTLADPDGNRLRIGQRGRD